MNIASSIAPVAPMAPPSVGVATPMKMVPSTRKIRNSGGTITNVTCCAISDRKRKPVSLSEDPVHHRGGEGDHDADRHAQHDEVSAAIVVSRIAMSPISATTVSRSNDTSPRSSPPLVSDRGRRTDQQQYGERSEPDRDHEDAHQVERGSLAQHRS